MIRPSAPRTVESGLDSMLTARPIGIDTYQEPIVYMRADCPVCRSEGFESQSRILVGGNGTSLIATLNVVYGEWLGHGEAGFSEIAWKLLGSDVPCPVTFSHPEPVESFANVRAKLFGQTLGDGALQAIVGDIAERRYTDVQLSAFLTACAGDRMSADEIVALTRAMVDAGQQLRWDHQAVFDKHCVGGLPGNRTTPIIVAIATACDLVMPKTSSRAITSPAGTADAMETLTTVDLSLEAMRVVVEKEGGCLVWGGSVDLSPADDVLIRVERALDVDSEAQLVASVLSKKIAAGSSHTVIDIPVGPTAKVRSPAAADRLSSALRYTGAQLGVNVEIAITDGSQPVGRGIGPALEARDVLAVLQRAPDAPEDLQARATLLAGRILELGGRANEGQGVALAQTTLADGRAWQKFQAICEAQGGLRTPPVARHRYCVVADRHGRVRSIDNRRLAKVAKLAGAPTGPAAGVELHARVGDTVEAGAPLLTLHAEAPGELVYALQFMNRHPGIVQVLEQDGGKGNG